MAKKKRLVGQFEDISTKNNMIFLEETEKAILLICWNKQTETPQLTQIKAVLT